jgi:hypothetical protein
MILLSISSSVKTILVANNYFLSKSPVAFKSFSGLKLSISALIAIQNVFLVNC